MSIMKNVVLRFEELPRELREDTEFGPIIKGVEAKTWHDYLLHDGYLRFFIVQELHKQGHFGVKKTLHLVRERFF
jgi:Integrase zinc binding domain